MDSDMFKKILVGLILAFTLATGQARAATITLDVITPAVVGSTFTVAVRATNLFAGLSPTDTLVGFGFNVAAVDVTMFQYVTAFAGSLFDPLLLSAASPMVTGFATNPLGIGPADFSGPLTLATLQFKALKAGTSGLSVSGNAFPDLGLAFFELPFAPISGSTNVTATSASAVPEPMTLSLLAIGLSAGALRNRRRRSSLL